MRKLFIISTFFLTILIILLAIVCLIIESNKTTIDRIAPSTEELRLKAEKLGSLRLTKKEVKEICSRLNRELIQLDFMKRLITITIVTIIGIMLIGIYKFDFSVKSFDGLSLLVVALLLFGIHWLVDEFCEFFYEGPSASKIRIGTLIGTLIIHPILFYVAYSMNELEINNNLHKQKWISYSAIVLASLTFLLVLFIGIGVLFTPDLSGNIT
jgi:hypothetical protein